MVGWWRGIAGQRCRRILGNADREVVLLQDPVGAFLGRAVHETTVDENDSRYLEACIFCHDDLLPNAIGARRPTP